jgi:AraC-like DNA-binding protein
MVRGAESERRYHSHPAKAPIRLMTSDLQVREIARRAGYAHHGTFIAAFTRQFGIAP